MDGIKAEQFDPSKDYPEHAWCAGPMDFRAATHRGHMHLSKTDWIVTFEETGEHIAVSDATYQRYFAPPKELLFASSPAEIALESESESDSPAVADPLAGEDPESGKPADSEIDSSGAELAANPPFDESSDSDPDDRSSAKNKRRNRN